MKRICSVDGCERKHYGRGFCSMHWKRWRDKGDTSDPVLNRDRLCEVPDCELPLYCAGVCEPHYGRRRRALLRESPAAPRCSVEDCDSPVSAKGLCGRHYQRVTKYGTTDLPEPPPRPACAVDGCERLSKSAGYCETHYVRFWKFGDAGTAEIRRKCYLLPDGRRECSKCAEVLPVEAFADGKAACRRCTKAAFDAWRAANPGYFTEWARANPEKVRETANRRRAQKLGTEVERIDRAAIFERDRNTCQLCGQGIPAGAKFPEPLSPSLDHIVPLSRGGTHTPDNLQATHLVCNLSKGQRTNAEVALGGLASVPPLRRSQ